jgi:hypothetical protein
MKALDALGGWQTAVKAITAANAKLLTDTAARLPGAAERSTKRADR